MIPNIIYCGTLCGFRLLRTNLLPPKQAYFEIIIITMCETWSWDASEEWNNGWSGLRQQNCLYKLQSARIDVFCLMIYKRVWRKHQEIHLVSFLVGLYICILAGFFRTSSCFSHVTCEYALVYTSVTWKSIHFMFNRIVLVYLGEK